MPFRLLRYSLIMSLCVLCGCISMKQNQVLDRNISAQKELKTREDVITKLGIPGNVINAKGNTYYVYVATEGYGGALGVGSVAVNLLIAHTKVASDTYVVEMGPDERVVNVHALAQADEIAYRLWPFGD